MKKKKWDWDEDYLTRMRFATDDEVFPLVESTVVKVKHTFSDIAVQNQKFAEFEQYIRFCVTTGLSEFDLGPFGFLPPELKNYFHRSVELPPWVDRNELEEARKMYLDNFFHVMCTLLLNALPKFLANELFSRALARSESLSQIPVDALLNWNKEVPREDALLQMSTMAAKTVGIIKLIVLIGSEIHGLANPQGRAVKLIRMIRLRHGLIRYHLKYQHGYDLTSTTQSPDSTSEPTYKCGWNSVKGEPLNQASLASAQVNLALNIMKGFYQLGLDMTEKEKRRNLLVWNIIAYYLGVDERLIPRTLKEAKALNRALQAQQFRVTRNATTLVSQLQDDVIGKLFPIKKQVIVGCMRALNSGSVGKQLKIGDENEWSMFISIFLAVSHQELFTRKAPRWIVNLIEQMIMVPSREEMERRLPEERSDGGPVVFGGSDEPGPAYKAPKFELPEDLR